MSGSPVAALIELGDERGAPGADVPRRPRPHRGESALAVAAGCLLLLGPAAPVAALPSAVGPPVPVSGTVLVAGDSVLVVDPPQLAAYDAAAPDRAPRWRARVSVAAGWSAESTAGLLLIVERGQVGQATATTARDAATGQQRWRRPDRVYAAGDQAIAVTEVRSAIEPGRRVEGAVRGVDPATGRTRWTVPVPSTAVVTVLPETPARVLLVHDSGLARVHDARGGAALGEGRLPPADYAPDNPQVVGGRLVLRHPTAAGPVLTGFDLPAFTARWQRPLPGGELTVRRCAGLLCLHLGPTRWALRPDTGAPAWTWPDGGAWRAVPGRRPAEPLVLLRPAADRERLLVGVVGPDGPRVRGVLPPGTRECRAAVTRLVCRVDGRVTVWRLDGRG
ncbi:PQQ-binding-like beta-propeller repeat protein [Micromonospora sp. NPDC047707]|uniref:outer membrane protein assembly factor BamB family protein n=1 Tax=Micromonospora sp. NPDC047707 TaxID=3154498 RepID=UPI003454F2B5